MPLLSTGWLTFREAEKALEDRNNIHLQSLSEARTDQLVDWLEGVRRDLATLSQSVATKDSLLRFDAAFQKVPEPDAAHLMADKDYLAVQKVLILSIKVMCGNRSSTICFWSIWKGMWCIL